MSDLLPLFLYEATLSLYPVADDGSALMDQPIWWGAVANNLRLSLEYDEVRMAGSGDAYPSAHHVDEQHFIDIERTWVLRKTALADYLPQRNQRYVLELVWESEGFWYKRTYFGVTGRSAGLDSVRALQFGNRLSYRAQSLSEDGGGAQEIERIYTPLPPPLPLPVIGGNSQGSGSSAPEEQSIGFFRENPMVPGEYLLGHYRWPVDANIVSARVVVFAPQTQPNVLSLEVGGALTDQTITIPVGAANTEVSATVALDYFVGAGQSVRWKITAGPDPENAAWVAALALQVQPLR